MSYPLVTDQGSLILDILFSAMLVMASYAVSHRRKVLVAALLLAVPTLILWWSVRVTDSMPFAFVGLALAAIFFLFVLFVLLHHVIDSDRADTSTIYAAMSAYLLIGATWAFFYALVDVASPGSFDFDSLTEQAALNAPHGDLRLYSYYSLVTLSTLGYGDITPLSPLARSLSALEAVTGQLFIAVLLARLVGLGIAHRRAD